MDDFMSPDQLFQGEAGEGLSQEETQLADALQKRCKLSMEEGRETLRKGGTLVIDLRNEETEPVYEEVISRMNKAGWDARYWGGEPQDRSHSITVHKKKTQQESSIR